MFRAEVRRKICFKFLDCGTHDEVSGGQHGLNGFVNFGFDA
jgi:hypothetical protein